MMKASFCENAATAKVEVYTNEGIVTIASEDTPIYIRYDLKSYRVFLYDNDANRDAGNLGLFPRFDSAQTFHRIYLYAFVAGGSTDFYVSFYGDKGGHSYIAHSVYDATPRVQWQYSYRWQSEDLPVFSVSDKNNLLYVLQSATLPQFKVFCDGCEPGDCKASKAKYPGYTCLDCAELSGRLKRIGNKIDGKNR